MAKHPWHGIPAISGSSVSFSLCGQDFAGCLFSPKIKHFILASLAARLSSLVFFFPPFLVRFLPSCFMLLSEHCPTCAFSHISNHHSPTCQVVDGIEVARLCHDPLLHVIHYLCFESGMPSIIQSIEKIHGHILLGWCCVTTGYKSFIPCIEPLFVIQ